MTMKFLACFIQTIKRRKELTREREEEYPIRSSNPTTTAGSFLHPINSSNPYASQKVTQSRSSDRTQNRP